MAGGEEVEIIVIDDGSTDRTGEIADCYAEKYPETVRAVHQKNGGHGAGVNKGLSLAAGEYFKVVDSDDWLDEEALKKLLTEIRKRKRQGALADLIICNYLYDHLYEGKQKRMGYENVFRDGKVCTWDTIGKFHPSQYLVMHAQICRTEVLRRSGVRLTFEVLLSGRSERASQGTAMDEISRWYPKYRLFHREIHSHSPSVSVFLHINGRTDSCR